MFEVLDAQRADVCLLAREPVPLRAPDHPPVVQEPHFTYRSQGPENREPVARAHDDPAGGAAGIAFLSGDSARTIGGLVLLGINVILIVVTGMIVLLAIGRGRRGGRTPARSAAAT